MRIRAITYFFDPLKFSMESVLKNISVHSQLLKKDLESAGYEVQSIRLATPTLEHWMDSTNKKRTLQNMHVLCNQVQNKGFDYLSLGPIQVKSDQDNSLILSILKLSNILFMSMPITDPRGWISLPNVRCCASLIKEIATIEANGFANLRFAATANVKPFTPFFPAAYGERGEFAFSFAMECADTAISIFEEAVDIHMGCQMLCDTFLKNAKEIETIIQKNAQVQPDLTFQGFDFSLAPYPEEARSFGKALEALGVGSIGSAGSVTAAAILAGALDAGKWKKAGFNGLMMPILEDSILAQRSASGALTIYDVLQYSCVCGTGLDTIPLAGDIAVEKIEALLLDVGALALRLHKPLTARLMPIPGKRAGDDTEFNFSYFAQGKVLDYPYSPLRQPLTVGEKIEIRRHA